MDMREIEELVDIVRNSRITELTVESKGCKVRVRKRLRETNAVSAPAPIEVETRPAAPEPAAANEPALEGIFVTAPMVGIFHADESVQGVGERVRKGQVVGCIESMKLMNEIVSDHDGVVAEVLVEDGMPVEYGQELFEIEPSPTGLEGEDAEE